MRPTLLALTAALVLTACGTTSPNTSDTTNPVASISIPSDYTDPSQVQIQYSATDNVAVTKLVIERDDTDNNVDNFVPIKTILAAPFSGTYTDTVPASGTYTYRVVAYDAAGNQGWIKQSVSLTVPEPLKSVSGTLTEPVNFSYPMTTKAWTGGAGQVILEAAPLTGGAASEISRSPLTSSGAFSLDLTTAPATSQRQSATVANLLGGAASQCSGDARSDTPQATMTVAQLRVSASKSGIAAPFTFLTPITVNSSQGATAQNNHLSLSGLIYVSQAVKFSGGMVCQRGPGKPVTTVLFPLPLYKGWNQFTVQTVTDSDGNITNITWSKGFLPSLGNNWVLLPQTVQTTP